jgi:hypothetical protein
LPYPSEVPLEKPLEKSFPRSQSSSVARPSLLLSIDFSFRLQPSSSSSINKFLIHQMSSPSMPVNTSIYHAQKAQTQEKYTCGLSFLFTLAVMQGCSMAVTDPDSVAGASNPRTNISYQMGQYSNAPPRDDPYSPGQLARGDAASMFAKLDAMLSCLQKSSHDSTL